MKFKIFIFVILLNSKFIYSSPTPTPTQHCIIFNDNFITGCNCSGIKYAMPYNETISVIMTNLGTLNVVQERTYNHITKAWSNWENKTPTPTPTDNILLNCDSNWQHIYRYSSVSPDYSYQWRFNLIDDEETWYISQILEIYTPVPTFTPTVQSTSTPISPKYVYWTDNSRNIPTPSNSSKNLNVIAPYSDIYLVFDLGLGD